MLRLSIAFFACWLLSFSNARAQSGESAVLIHVRSAADDTAIVGGSVTITGPGPSSDVRVDLDNRQGDILVPSLRAGRYRLSLTHQGYDDVAASLDLAPYEILRVRVVLTRSDDPAPSRIVVLSQATSFHGRTFDEGLLTALPSGRSPWSIVETADASAIVDRIDDGGLTTGRPGLVGVNGTSWTQTSYVWDGHDVTRPDVTGLPFVYPDFASVARLSLASALLPVDLRGPGGVMLMNVDRAPTEWSGRAAVAIAPASAARTDTPAPAIDRLSRWSQVNLWAAGPAVAKRLQLSGSATRTTMERHERGGPRTLPSEVTSASLTSIARISPDHELTTGVALSDTQRDEDRRVDELTGATAVDLRGRFRIQRRDGGSWSLGGTYLHVTLDGLRRNPNTVIVVDPIRDGPIVDRLPARGRRVSVWRVETSWAARSRASSGWLHAWRAGAAISRSRAVSSWIAEPLTLGEVVADRPARIWTYTAGGPRSVWTGTDVAGYVAQRAALRDVLDLEAGARVDMTRMSGMAWSRISPRVGMRWHIRETVDILGGYARYAHRLPLTHLAFGDPRAPSVDVRLWNDRNSDGVPQPAEAGTLVARLGPGNRDGNRSSLDPDLAVPWTDEVVAGLEWKPTARVRLGVTGLRRRDRRLIASVNSGLGPSDFDVRLLGDPGGDLLDPSDDQRLPVFERRPDSFGRDREILTNPPGLGSFFEALEIVLDRRADNWRLLFGATASRTVGSAANRGVGPLSNDQSTGGELFLAPNAATFKEGRLFFDRAFTVKLAGTVRAPLGIGLGFIARYQDGQPFARLVVVDDLAQGPDVVRAVPNGRHRFQYLATLDARLARTFMVLNGALTISLDAFNLLNDANEVEEDVVSGPRFRAVTAVQPPRTIRVGLAVSF